MVTRASLFRSRLETQSQLYLLQTTVVLKPPPVKVAPVKDSGVKILQQAFH